LRRSSRLDQHRSKGLLSPFSTGLTFLLLSLNVSHLPLHPCTTRCFPTSTKTLQPPSLVPRGDFPAFQVPPCPEFHLPPSGLWFLYPRAVSSVTRELVLKGHWSLLARGTTGMPGLYLWYSRPTLLTYQLYRQHRKRHTRPYRCTICSKGFYQDRDLQRHINTHTGTRDFHCPVQGCDKVYTREDGVTRHMNAKHLEVAQQV